MTPKLIPLLERCIETGFDLGWARAHKHTTTPDEAHLKAQIANAIWQEIHEWFSFDGEQ